MLDNLVDFASRAPTFVPFPMTSPYASAETSLNGLKKKVVTLRAGLTELEEGEATADAVHSLAEQITQALIEVDGIAEISKGAAAEAFRAKDRKTATMISVLIAKRKRVVRDLNDLGDRVDELADVTAVGDGVEEIDLAGGDDDHEDGANDRDLGEAANDMGAEDGGFGEGED